MEILLYSTTRVNARKCWVKRIILAMLVYSLNHSRTVKINTRVDELPFMDYKKSRN